MGTTMSPARDLSGALATAASLIATAALVHAAGAAGVRVVVSGTDIDIQVPHAAATRPPGTRPLPPTPRSWVRR
jgi:hypothetical protein